MKQIDLDPRRHSHLYEVRAASRWALVPIVGFLGLGIWRIGASDPFVWCTVFFAAASGFALPVVFPRFFYEKLPGRSGNKSPADRR